MSSFARILPFVKPLEHLLLDPGVTEVMVNAGGRRVFVERDGLLAEVPDLVLDEYAASARVDHDLRHVRIEQEMFERLHERQDARKAAHKAPRET